MNNEKSGQQMKGGSSQSSGAMARQGASVGASKRLIVI